MKEPWQVGTYIQVRPILGIKGDVWQVETVENGWYQLCRDDGSNKRKILRFENQDNWEEVPDAK